MLNRTTAMKGCRVSASDGGIGHIDDLYFDDERWVLRYLVVDTGGWLTSHKVLISPYAVAGLDVAAGVLTLNLTRATVEGSPDIDTDRPVSRQYEIEYSRYYSYPVYWPASTFWAGGALPIMNNEPLAVERAALAARETSPEVRDRGGDSHLRSNSEVIGYGIEAGDGSVGHVEDFLFDDKTWALSCLVVDTRNWWPGKHVVVSRHSIHSVDWPAKSVSVDLSRAEIKAGLEFDPAHLPTPDEAQALGGSTPAVTPRS